jgi:hypothetical protein
MIVHFVSTACHVSTERSEGQKVLESDLSTGMVVLATLQQGIEAFFKQLLTEASCVLHTLFLVTRRVIIGTYLLPR